MNNANDPFELRLKSVAPSPPTEGLRNRIEQDLKTTIPLRWKIGVTVVMTSIAAAIVLMITLNPGATPDPEPNPSFANSPDDSMLVLTFPIAEDDLGPVAGNWNPYLLQYLIPQADVIVYGKVERGTKTTVEFTVHDVLRGKLQTLRIDASQEKWAFGGCGPELAQWPLGDFCCVYLKYDKEKKVYRFIDSGVPIQELPYHGVLEIEMLREVIRVWDAEFAGKSQQQQKDHYASLGEREQLIFDIVTGGYLDDHTEKLRRLNTIGVAADQTSTTMPVDTDLSGVREIELSEQHTR